MTFHDRYQARGIRSKALFALVALGTSTFGFSGTSGADVTELSGSAFGHWSTVSLFGGPQGVKAQNPTVTLPPNGADPALVAKEAFVTAKYGPATVFGGKWPIDQDIAPPSGPITVTTKGTTGPGGSVTSTVDIVLRDPPNPASPGGFGPTVPSEGDELHSRCTAGENGVTGSATFVNGILATSTDSSGEPKDTEPIPDNPPPNYTRTGQITNVGDNWKIIFNEQIIEGGSITVNAIHMYLLGPIAVGEQIVGQVKCSAKVVAGATPPSSAPANPASPAAAAKPGTPKASTAKPATVTSVPPTTVAAAPPVTEVSTPPSTDAPPSSVAPTTAPSQDLSAAPIVAKKEKSSTAVLPLLLGALALVVGGAVVVPRIRRRRIAGGEHPDGHL